METSLLSYLKKYDQPGPRYTSYPPAPVFSSEFGAEKFREHLIRTNASGAGTDLSLYLHLPFCDTLCYFCGCTMLVTHSHDRIKEYLGYLEKEIDLLAATVANERRVVQLHWGGGTPTALDPSEIAQLASHLHKRFRFAEDAEVSVEIDPRELTLDHMRALRDSGFNRVSIGVQDFAPDVQQAINRIQPEEMTREVIGWARQLGFSSINIDLIYGLPLQTEKSFAETLKKIIEIAAERLAIYNFAYVPWLKPHQKLIKQDEVPSPETRLILLASTIEKLISSGYEYIGMDHFARPGDELTRARRTRTLHRNFQGYSTKAGCDLYGLGMSSISHFDTVYAQNAKTLPEYYEALKRDEFPTHVGYEMTHDDEVRKYVIMRLMCDLVLEKDDVDRRFEITFDTYFQESLEALVPLSNDGLIGLHSDRLEVTDTGRLFLRNIAMCFDAHLARLRKEKPIFSRTV